MNFSSRKLSAYVLVAAAFTVAVSTFAYHGVGAIGSQVAQVTSGLTEQTVGYETAVKFSTGYSSTQGKNNWSYQYRKDADEFVYPGDRETQGAIALGYTNMTWTNNRWEAPGTFPLITKGALHPGTHNEAVLKWTAPKAGEVRITGTAYDNDAGGGDGVKARIFKDSIQLWTSGVIRNGDTTGKSHTINTTVTAGQAIYFIVDNNSYFGNHFYDTTKWDPSIAYKTNGDPDPDPGIVKGTIDTVGKDAGGTFVQGWACHEGVDQAITVDIYAGAAKGATGSTFLIKTPATNIDSNANVHTACDTPTAIKHNFKYYFTPAAATLHAGKKLYLYGNSTTGAAGDKILGKSGQVSLPTVTPDVPGVVKGNITSVAKDSGGTFVEGWACHEGVDKSITVDIYVGAAKGTAGSTFIIKTPVTNITSSAAVHTACDTPTAIKHNFKYYFTAAALTAHAGKKLYLYGNSTTGAAGDKLLARSGAVSLPTITPGEPGVVKGNIVSVGKDSTGTFVEGWACHEGVDKSITVDIYVGAAKGAAGSTFIIKTPVTNLTSSAAVHTACDTPAAIKHNFKYYFTPAAATLHAGKKLYLYGNSTTGVAGNKLLSRSGAVSLPTITPGKTGVVKGNIASIVTDSTGTFVQGWACHEGVDKAITVDIYAGAAKGAAGSVFVIKTPATNIASPAAVHTACDTPTAIKHNFKYYFTAAALTAHAGKKIYMYGNSTSSTTPDVILTRSGAVSLPGTPPEPTIEGYDIIIVGGQSNAIGGGKGPYPDSAQTDAIDAKLFQLGRYGTTTNKAVPAVKRNGSIRYDALQHWGVGLQERDTIGFSIPFARRYARDELATNRRVLIVPSAAAGTSIRKWLGEQGTPHLYDHMKNRVETALNLPGNNRIVAMLWHQGESDILAGMTTTVYSTKLTSLFNLLRADFPATTPYPIIAGGFVPAWTTGSAYKLSYETTIADVLSDDENGGFVSSAGLASNPGDALHFSSSALVTFGDRYYEKWKDLNEGGPDPEPGIVKGAIDTVGKDAGGTFVQGWACHAGVDKSITVDIYAGGAKGTASSTLVIKTPVTNLVSSAAVHTACDTPAAIKHNFKYYFTPAAATLHAGKKLYLYGNSTTGAAGDKILSRSGAVSLPDAEPEPPSTCSMSAEQSEKISTGKAIVLSSTAQSSASAIVSDDVVFETGTQAQSSLPAVDTGAIYKKQAAGGTSPQAGGSSVRTAVTSGPWSSTTTWGGVIPAAGNAVRIPSGITVTLDTAAQAAGVEINGVLKADTVSASLSATWVMVMGSSAKFEVGTAAAPFTKNFTLELRGNNTGENIHGAGTKFLMAMDGGQISMHGKPKTSWTKLSGTVNAGATKIRLSESVDWEVGNQIVIAPSSRTADQAEVRTITARSTDCKTFTLNTALSYRHVGVQQSYSSGSRSWVLDQRAEVGLLSHNVKIQGDASSESTSFGAHVMIMKGAKGYFSSVELHRMGQKKILGRYPIHWHMHENTSSGQYFRNSSIHRSYNRAVTIHGSEGISIERNVAYDHMGHGIFLEDASEQNNKINYNLVMLTRKPAPGDQLLPSDNSHNEVQNKTPSSFWITNPNNEFIGNVAAGTVGTGFWFAFPDTALGLSKGVARYSSIVPRKQALGVFKNNVAHSNGSGFDVHDSITGSHAIATNVPYDPASVAVVDGFTSYSNVIGIYTGAAHRPTITLTKKLVFRNVISADIFREHLRFANADTVENSVFIADSGNKIVPAVQPRTFLASYDGPAQVRNSHLVGFNNPKATMFTLGGAHIKHANILFDGVTSDPKVPYMSNPDFALVTNGNTYDTALEHISMDVIDKKGTLTGTPNTSIISSNPLQRTSTDKVWPNGDNMYISKHSFTNLKVAGGKGSMTVTRSGGGEPDKTYTDSHVWAVIGENRFQFHPIVNGSFTYTLRFSSTPGSVSFEHMDGKPGDTVNIRVQKPDGTFVGTTLTRTSAVIDRASISVGGGGGGGQTP